MRVAILESISMPAGHEVEFDRILVNELMRQGHEPIFFVPANFPFKDDYGVPVVYLDGGEVVTYAGASKWKKPFLSLLREKRRRAWFTAAAKEIKSQHCDALIIPTSTYRYVNALLDTPLKDSTVPIHLIFHGIGKKELERFHKQARRARAYRAIYMDVITLRDDMLRTDLTNIRKIMPPVFLPASRIDVNTGRCELPELSFHQPLRLGFFGQFRKEKNIIPLLDAFIKARFVGPVTLLVQGATAKPEDGVLFDSIAAEYKKYKNITFLHTDLIGKNWDEALLNTDAFLMPYGVERYRYHWSAMLFTAIGFKKPVLVSPEINPEVLCNYHIGETVDLASVETICSGLESFVNTLLSAPYVYRQGLEAANRAYSHENLIKAILNV